MESFWGGDIFRLWVWELRRGIHICCTDEMSRMSLLPLVPPFLVEQIITIFVPNDVSILVEHIPDAIQNQIFSLVHKKLPYCAYKSSYYHEKIRRSTNCLRLFLYASKNTFTSFSPIIYSLEKPVLSRSNLCPRLA